MAPHPNERFRDRMRRVLQAYFEHHRQVRLILWLLITLTGLVGFGFSVLLLRAGMTSMGLRYPLAVLGAYLVFLGLIRLWVAMERRAFDPESPAVRDAMAHPASAPPLSPADSPEKSGWLDWLDLTSIGDLDFGEAGCVLGILVGILAALAGLLVLALGAAPLLVAEVFMDAALSALLYRRLKHAAERHWLGTAIRRTWLFVLATLLLLGTGGWLLDHQAPGSDTVGRAIREVWARRG